MPTVYDAHLSHTTGSHASTLHKRGVFLEAQRRHIGPFTSFSHNPRNVRFETQEEEERVVLFLRQHVIINIPWLAVSFLMLIFPTVLFPLIWQYLSVAIRIPPAYMLIGLLIWYLGTFGFVLSSFINWFFNIYIVTNERIVDIDFLHLLYKHFTQAELNRIQEISYTTGGIVATFFNYGRVIIQTAGDMPNLEFDRVPYPEKVVTVIREQMENLGGSI